MNQMGTSKSGRYLNTKGAKHSVSDFALVHADEGKYTKPSKKNDKLRLVSGGHGQTNLEQLDKYGIEHTIEKTYLNDVRVGSVKNHYEKSKRENQNQAWFPKSWTINTIKKAGKYVLNLKRNKNAKDGKVIWGTYKGVKVGVIKTNERVGTIFPDKKQRGINFNSNKNKKENK